MRHTNLSRIEQTLNELIKKNNSIQRKEKKKINLLKGVLHITYYGNNIDNMFILV
jgi:hypothetical protein